MNISDTKKKILEEADYTYHRDRKVYYNQKAKKVFSSEAVKVNDEHWLRRCIEEVSSVGDWGFYFQQLLRKT